jgi:hypothetical protein
MKLTAVFEHWHLGDGNYPAFSVGDEGRLSFELGIASVDLVPADASPAFEHVRDAEYAVTARVIRLYSFGGGSPFPVFEASDGMRFFSPASPTSDFILDSVVRLRGTLMLDHYQWVEFLGRYNDPPGLFYSVRVARIRRIVIPKRFVKRDDRSVGHPTSLSPDDYAANAYDDVQTIEESPEGPSFSLIDFEMLPDRSDESPLAKFFVA